MGPRLGIWAWGFVGFVVALTFIVLAVGAVSEIVLPLTALGGLLGGVVGLILAVPAWVLVTSAISRLRRRGFFERAVERAEPTVRAMLQ